MRIIRTPELTRLVGLSRITIWRMMRRGQFPQKIKLGERSIGRLEDEVLQWLRQRVEER